MSGRFDDMIRLSRPRFDEFPPMSAHDRAAQFAPFAALVGYDEAVGETERLTESRAELTEDMADELNEKMKRLLDSLKEQPVIRVVYFVPDERKAGGKYVEKQGAVRTFDEESNELVFTDRSRVKAADVDKLEFVSAESSEDDLGE